MGVVSSSDVGDDGAFARSEAPLFWPVVQNVFNVFQSPDPLGLWLEEAVQADPRLWGAGDVKVFENKMLLGMGKNLVVRDCYVKIFKEISQWFKQKPTGLFVVTGTPGIGKSVFMGYVAAQLAANNIPIVIQRDPNFWSREAGGPVVKHGKVEPERLLKREEVVLLFDPFDATSDLKMLREVGRTIIFTSPSMKSYNAVWKQQVECTRRFMPVWSIEELQKHCQELFPPERTEDEVKKAYEDLGGCLRRLRRNLVQGETAKVILEMYIKNCPDVNALKLLVTRATQNPEDMSETDLFQIQSVPDFRDAKISFLGSEVARSVLMQKMSMHAEEEQLKFIQTFIQSDVMAQMVGRIFEVYVKAKLRKGPRNLRYRKMEATETFEEVQTPKDFVDFEDDVPSCVPLQRDKLYNPPPNYPTADLFFVRGTTLWLLQTTKAVKHNCKIGKLQHRMLQYFEKKDLDKIQVMKWIVVVPQLLPHEIYQQEQDEDWNWWTGNPNVSLEQFVSFFDLEA